MALALATVIAWLLLASVVVMRGRLRRDPEWAPWDVLRGVRALAVERLSESLTLRLSMVEAGAEWGARAQAAGRAEDAATLARATLATTRTMARQLDGELAAYAEHARVLQTAAGVEPLRARELKTGKIQTLARAERGLAACVGSVARLRLHVWVLRRALALIQRRADNEPRAIGYAADSQADLTTLARATVTSYRALLASLDASRRRIGANVGVPPAADG
jgi:hypothetical protein